MPADGVERQLGDRAREIILGNEIKPEQNRAAIILSGILMLNFGDTSFKSITIALVWKTRQVAFRHRKTGLWKK